MNLFYTPDLTGGTYTLSGEESNHLIRVLRFKKGETIFLTDGKGKMFKASLANEDPKACLVDIIETTPDYGKRNYSLHIGIAPTKNIERFEWFLEKATEIGIDEITPVICEHSERRDVKPERLKKVIVAAMKQSVKAYLPELHPAKSYKEFVSGKSNGQKFICTLAGKEKNNPLKNSYVNGMNPLILIGPEGDFSGNEINLAEQNQFIKVSLGESRLRTETAGIAACHTISLLNQ
jgi:16S rRNA (uracil1498-N3)-methyltransferase